MIKKDPKILQVLAEDPELKNWLKFCGISALTAILTSQRTVFSIPRVAALASKRKGSGHCFELCD